MLQVGIDFYGNDMSSDMPNLGINDFIERIWWSVPVVLISHL